MDERRIKDIINAYSRSRQHHPYADYGNKVHVVTAVDCPVYKCTVTTQYEKRSKKSVTNPFKGGSVKPQTVTDLGQVKAWGFKLSQPQEFVDKKTFIKVDGSQTVATCNFCQGKGKNTCYQCHGVGESTCSNCGGKGDMSCPDCNGTGWQLCPECNGSRRVACPKCGGSKGHYEEKTIRESYYENGQLKYRDKKEKHWVSCYYCSGSGYRECMRCHDTRMLKRGYITCRACGNMGHIQCSNCGGTGKNTCRNCSGKGFLTCNTCQGYGQNETYFQVDRELYSETLRKFVCDSRVESFAMNGKYSSSVVFDSREDALGTCLWPENARCSSALDRLVAQSTNDSGKILFQQARVRKADTVYVEYTFDGKSYSGIICDNVFHTEHSPIDDYTEGLLEKAESKFKMGSSVAALKAIEKAKLAGMDSDDFSELQTKARLHINTMFNLGVSAMFWIIALFFTPILFNFYSNLNPVAPWAIVTNNPAWWCHGAVAITQCIIFLTAIILAKAFISDTEAWRKKHDSIWAYVLIGMAKYLLICLAILAVMVAANYAGLSMLTSWIGGLAWWVVKLVISIIFIAVMLVVTIVKKIFALI